MESSRIARSISVWSASFRTESASDRVQGAVQRPPRRARHLRRDAAARLFRPAEETRWRARLNGGAGGIRTAGSEALSQEAAAAARPSAAATADAVSTAPV